jgi:hypothetical protein
MAYFLQRPSAIENQTCPRLNVLTCKQRPFVPRIFPKSDFNSYCFPSNTILHFTFCLPLFHISFHRLFLGCSSKITSRLTGVRDTGTHPFFVFHLFLERKRFRPSYISSLLCNSIILFVPRFCKTNDFIHHSSLSSDHWTLKTVSCLTTVL